MSTPVTGPFTEYYSTRWTGRYRWWYRSARDDAGNLVLAPHPHKAAKCKAKGGQLSWNLLGNNGLGYHYLNPQAVCSDAYAICYDRFSRDVWRDAQTQLLVDFAERKQTMQLLIERFAKCYNAMRACRRGDFRDAWRLLTGGFLDKSLLQKMRRNGTPSDAFLQNWMELRYGWMPLYHSVHDLCETLTTSPEDSVVRASAKTDYDFTAIATSGSLIGKPKWRFKWSKRVRMQGKVLISDPALASLQQYGLLNPLSVAWELVPLSFVVDWWLPVGDVIADQTRFVGLTFAEAFTSYRIHGEDWYEKGVFSNPSCTVFSTLKQRVLWTGASPSLPSRWQLADSISATHCLDALALITGFGKRYFRS